jgi:predicted lipid carrier protein YhbT
MVMDEVLARFVKRSPACVMVQAVLEHTLSAPAVDAIFERTAERQYTDKLLFSTVVDVPAKWCAERAAACTRRIRRIGRILR